MQIQPTHDALASIVGFLSYLSVANTAILCGDVPGSATLCQGVYFPKVPFDMSFKAYLEYASLERPSTSTDGPMQRKPGTRPVKSQRAPGFRNIPNDIDADACRIQGRHHLRLHNVDNVAHGSGYQSARNEVNS